MKIIKSHTFARLPRFDFNLYNSLVSLSFDEAKQELKSEKFQELFELINEENSNYKLDKENLTDKDCLTILNYLMRATTRCTPYKAFAGVANLDISQNTKKDFFTDKNNISVKVNKAASSNPFETRKTLSPTTLLMEDHGFVMTASGIYTERDHAKLKKIKTLFSMGQNANKALDKIGSNPFITNIEQECSLFKMDTRRTQLDYKIKNNVVPEELVSKISNQVHDLAFLNGECGTKSFMWLEKIRAKIFSVHGPAPISLKKLIYGEPLLATPTTSLTNEAQNRNTPLRNKLRDLISSEIRNGSQSLILTDDSIKSLRSLSMTHPTDLSESYSLIVHPNLPNHLAQIKYHRSSYQGLRLPSQYLNSNTTTENGQSLATKENYIFAEILSMGNCKNKVLLNRPLSTNYGINIDGYSEIEGINYIELDDLYVYASNFEIVLFSKSLNKRIIPTLTTSYLAENDENLFYRFLASLGKRHFSQGLTFDLFWMNFNFYPEIHYKDLLIFPRTWVLDQSSFLDKTKLNSLSLPEFVRVLDGDKDALLKTNSEHFIHFIKKLNYPTVILQEDHSHKSTVNTDNGGSWINELMFSYQKCKDQKPKIPYILYKDQFAKSDQDIIQLEIFCLSNFMYPLMRKIVKDIISTDDFYFIFYQHPSSHIRLRVINSSYSSQALMEKINELKEEFTIHKVYCSQYENEVEQYESNEGVNVYIDTSVQLSKRLIQLKNQLAPLNSPVIPGWGGLLEISYLANLLAELSKSVEINLNSSTLTTNTEHANFKKLWSWNKVNKVHELSTELNLIFQKDLEILKVHSESWEKIRKHKDINFFIQRLIHMEIFRHSNGEFKDMNKIILLLASKIKQNETLKN